GVPTDNVERHCKVERDTIELFRAMLSIFLCALLLASVVEARVTFQLSEVLQENDLGLENRAPFKCENGCNAYTDSQSNNMYITEYNDQTGLYSIVVKSREATARSVITVFSPISTVDFGDDQVGQHYAHVEWSKTGVISQSARSSTIYAMSTVCRRKASPIVHR
ncbi:hypothetical protein PMAYCL1PPCAC_00847, partial [Pristionchus mayeri]